MSPRQILRLRLRRDRTAPRVARNALAGVEAIAPVHDDALLVASELATNAVMDSEGGSGKEMELLAELVPDGLRIAVINPSADRKIASGDGQLRTPAGAGLRIVRAIARRWGTERVDGEQVWAVLAM